MNALKIFGENWVNGDCAFSASANFTPASLAYLYDQYPLTKAITTGSNNATEEYIAITFKNWEGTEISCTFDRIILLNHNIKSGQFDYWDGAWESMGSLGALSNVSNANTLLELASPITASRIRFRQYTTQTTDAQKYIGELKICLSVIPGTQLWRSDIPRSDWQKSGNFRLGDGGLVFWKEYTKFEAAGTLYDIAKEDHDLLFAYFKAAFLLTIVFYGDFDLTECFECALINPPNHKLNRKTQLYDQISLEMKER